MHTYWERRERETFFLRLSGSDKTWTQFWTGFWTSAKKLFLTEICAVTEEIGLRDILCLNPDRDGYTHAVARFFLLSHHILDLKHLLVILFLHPS